MGVLNLSFMATVADFYPNFRVLLSKITELNSGGATAWPSESVTDAVTEIAAAKSFSKVTIGSLPRSAPLNGVNVHLSQKCHLKAPQTLGGFGGSLK